MTLRASPLEDKLDRIVSLLQGQTRAQDSLHPHSFSKSLISCLGEPSSSQSDKYLANFRTHMLRFFPAFQLAPDISSQQLRHEKPFLWLCIMCVASTSTAHQIVLGESIKQIVAREVVHKSQRNMDFFLGLLVFIAWSVPHRFEPLKAYNDK